MRSTLRIVSLLILGSPAFAQPTISQVLNSYSYTLPGLPNYGIAQGSIFSIFGAGLAPSTTPLQVAPLKDTLNGVTVAVTVGGVTTRSLLYFLSPTQINAVLPSNTPVGAGQIVVTAGGQDSAPAPIQVVAAAFGLATAGTVLATDVTGHQIYFSPGVRPGDYITLWGTGLGAIVGSDGVAPPVLDLSTPIEVEIGGIPARVLYHGRGGYPGLDQINIEVPQTAPGCAVSVVVRSGDIVSNFGRLPVETNVADCNPGTVTVTVDVKAGTGVKQGSVSLIHSLNKIDPIVVGGVQIAPAADLLSESGSASFIQEPPTNGFPLTSVSVSTAGGETPGSCSVVSYSYPFPVTAVSPSGGTSAQPTVLNAGPSLSVSGSLGDKVLALNNGTYSATLNQGPPSGPSFISATGGTLTVHAPGGSDVGGFDVPVTLAPLLQWTNRDIISKISRSQALAITWQGGQPGTFVRINGTSTVAGTTSTLRSTFECTAPVEAGTFTVPESVLLAMPASVQVATTSDGNRNVQLSTLSVENNFLQTFTATGLDFGAVVLSVDTSRSVIFQ